jgi:hypothetical protein
MVSHCCEEMRQQAERVCDQHLDRFECADCVIDYSPTFREYGLIIHDGGTSSYRISFCPWCGVRLPESLRNRWFEEMERRGIDPWEDEVPEEFQSAAWWAGGLV